MSLRGIRAKDVTLPELVPVARTVINIDLKHARIEVARVCPNFLLRPGREIRS